jgi:hypothetical protein
VPKRVVDFDSGVAMVVTDLHGAGDVYRHLRDKFMSQFASGKVDRLVICGDLIHAENTRDRDYSLWMLLDLMSLRAEMGPEAVVMLLGNHELPHIYGMILSKGDMVFTPSFEAALAQLDKRDDAPFRRRDVIDFLMGLPFYARTRGGVLLAHAGATRAVATPEEAELAAMKYRSEHGHALLSPPHSIENLLNFDHRTLLARIDARIAESDLELARAGYEHMMGFAYAEGAYTFLSVSGPDDPRYNDLLRMPLLDQEPDFQLLWDALFTQNEREIGLPAYEHILRQFLGAMSEAGPHEQRVIVAGHIKVEDGFAEVCRQQLRMATYTHARPREEGRYLLLDCAKRVDSASDLVGSLRYTLD